MSVPRIKPEIGGFKISVLSIMLCGPLRVYAQRAKAHSTLGTQNHRAYQESALVLWMHWICCDNMNAKSVCPADIS